MPRTAIPVTTLTPNAFTARPAGVAADPTNDHEIDCSGFPPEELIIEITQTDATARAATLVAGDNPPADAAGQGNVTQSIAQNAVWLIGPQTSARFIQSDGKIHIDLAASFAGTIRAYRIPRTA